MSTFYLYIGAKDLTNRNFVMSINLLYYSAITTVTTKVLKDVKR